jgi:chloramphenicol 3-O phosphotransferase
LFEEMYGEVARLARIGMNVAVDVGHHDDYSASLRIVDRVGEWLAGIPTLWVGVRCDLDVIMRRRDRSGDGYVGSGDDGSVPDPVLRWEQAVHDPGDYDLEVDTSQWSAADCAAAILAELARRS